MATTAPSKFQVWVLASRPKTLPAAIAPVLLGSALAASEHAFALGACLAAFLGAGLIQIGANLANDYFDFKSGADTESRLGPLRVTQAGLAEPAEVLRAAAIAFTLASLAGLYLLMIGGWPIAVIGIASILAALAYTGGPFPLGYNGLGEIFVFIFFGFVAVLGTTYVEALHLTPMAWLLALPMGLLSSAILVVNNLRDIETDQQAGKRTLAAKYGERFAKFEYAAFVGGAYLVPVALVLTGKLGMLGLLPLLSLPWAYQLLRSVWMATGSELNRTLAATGQLLLVFSILLSAGLLL